MRNSQTVSFYHKSLVWDGYCIVYLVLPVVVSHTTLSPGDEGLHCGLTALVSDMVWVVMFYLQSSVVCGYIEVLRFAKFRKKSK